MLPTGGKGHWYPGPWQGSAARGLRQQSTYSIHYYYLYYTEKETEARES